MGWLSSQFRLAGGLNEEDPQFTQKPGAAAFMQNYECLPGGGYRRIGGYDVWRPSSPPSEQFTTYKKLAFINGVLEPSGEFAPISATPSNNISAYVIDYELVSGSWGEGDAAGWLIITGGFSYSQPDDGDVIIFDDSYEVCCETYPGALVDSELSDTQYAEWNQRALDLWRAMYGAGLGNWARNAYWVPADDEATGPVLGLFTFEDKLYGWRANNADPTKASLYDVATNFAIPPTPYLPYDDGTLEFLRGDAIVGGTSGATADIIEVNIAFGNFKGPSYATGRLFLANVVGTFQNNEEIRVSGQKCALVNGTLTTPTILSGNMAARHRTIVTNFYGNDNLSAVYGVDGYNDPYCFDGTNLMFFDNTMPTKPRYIETHRNHLFLAYAGGSVQNSATGLPMVWSVRFGASEIGIGDDPVGMKSNGNNTLAVAAENSVHIITGTSDLDWNVRVIADAMTVTEDSLASVGGQTLFLDYSGVNWLLPAPPTFQDYTTQQISRTVRKTIETMAPRAVFAMSVPRKSQYMLFFDDKTLLLATFYGNKLIGWSKCKFLHQMTCGTTGAVGGEDMTFFGTDDGYVVRGDYGPSFMGDSIQSIVQLPFCYHGHPDREKRFHKITLEMETPATIDLRVHMDFDYGTGAQTGNFVAPTGATGGQWDISRWERFFWDSGVLTAPETNIDGVGRNTAITLYHDERTAEPFTVSAALLQFSLYGIKR